MMSDRYRRCRHALGILLLAWLHFLSPLQAGEVESPAVDAPRWAAGKGPVVAIDSAHLNFHSLKNRYPALGAFLAKDGYVVRDLDAAMTAGNLREVDILVIANPLHEHNYRDWSLPSYPALTPAEIHVIVSWVKRGGALLLIADHLPFAGAAQGLASAFGVRMLNGYALDSGDSLDTLTVFGRTGGGVTDHEITNGHGDDERVERVVTFLGQAFKGPDNFRPLLVFSDTAVAYMPVRAGRIESIDDWPRVGVGGWWQAAAADNGSGRVAIFGEALMFAGRQPDRAAFKNGLFPPRGGQNPRLILNLFHWLSGV